MARRKSSTSGQQAAAQRLLVALILLALLGLLALALWWQQHHRPDASPPPRNDVATVRLATWNLRMFSDGRRADLRTITDIINQSQFDLLAIQEVKGAGDEVDRLLNTLGPPWRSTSLSDRTGSNYERFVFLYKGDRLQEIGRAHLIQSPEAATFDRLPYQASFRCANFDFTVISVHLQWTDTARRRREAVALAGFVKDLAARGPEHDIIVVGDFNEERRRPNLQCFEEQGWEKLIGEPTNLSSKEIYDNVLIDPAPTKEWTRRSGVVRFDETRFTVDSRARADVSDHRPAWADFATDQPDDD